MSRPILDPFLSYLGGRLEAGLSYAVCEKNVDDGREGTANLTRLVSLTIPSESSLESSLDAILDLPSTFYPE